MLGGLLERELRPFPNEGRRFTCLTEFIFELDRLVQSQAIEDYPPRPCRLLRHLIQTKASVDVFRVHRRLLWLLEVIPRVDPP